MIFAENLWMQTHCNPLNFWQTEPLHCLATVCEPAICAQSAWKTQQRAVIAVLQSTAMSKYHIVVVKCWRVKTFWKLPCFHQASFLFALLICTIWGIMETCSAFGCKIASGVGGDQKQSKKGCKKTPHWTCDLCTWCECCLHVAKQWTTVNY